LRVAGWGGCQDSCREVELRGRHSTLLGGASGTEKKVQLDFLEIELSGIVTTSFWVAKQQVLQHLAPSVAVTKQISMYLRKSSLALPFKQQGKVEVNEYTAFNPI
jgi:hypothetical protein